MSMGRPRAIQQSRKVEQKSALTVSAKWEGAAFCWKNVIKMGKNFLQCWNEGLLSHFWKWNWKLCNVCSRSFQSRSVISVYRRGLLFGPVKLCCLFSCLIWLTTTYHQPFQSARLNHIRLLFNYAPVVWLYMITPLKSFVQCGAKRTHVFQIIVTFFYFKY